MMQLRDKEGKFTKKGLGKGEPIGIRLPLDIDTKLRLDAKLENRLISEKIEEIIREHYEPKA
jgi:hypothetical protein